MLLLKPQGSKRVYKVGASSLEIAYCMEQIKLKLDTETTLIQLLSSFQLCFTAFSNFISHFLRFSISTHLLPGNASSLFFFTDGHVWLRTSLSCEFSPLGRCSPPAAEDFSAETSPVASPVAPPEQEKSNL